MSDLSDLAAEVSKDLPAQIRKVIDQAVEYGWELNAPGMTLALRLNHPTDDLAQPVYITWVVGRTPKGKLSFKFMSCGTAGLSSLSGADLLEYLADPTTVYMSDEDIREADEETRKREAAQADKKAGDWDSKLGTAENLGRQLGAGVLRVERTTAAEIIKDQKARITAPSVRPTEGPLTPVKPLRVQIPTPTLNQP